MTDRQFQNDQSSSPIYLKDKIEISPIEKCTFGMRFDLVSPEFCAYIFWEGDLTNSEEKGYIDRAVQLIRLGDMGKKIHVIEILFRLFENVYIVWPKDIDQDKRRRILRRLFFLVDNICNPKAGEKGVNLKTYSICSRMFDMMYYFEG